MDSGKRCGARTTRRTIVKVGGAIAYTAPIVAASFSLADLEASAQEEKKPRPISGNPDPGCKGANCGNFSNCAGSDRCFCFSTAQGGGFCAVSVSCAVLLRCPGGQGDCPGGSICLVDTCCGEPVCKPVSFRCDNGMGVPAAADNAIAGKGPTTGGN